MGYKINLPIFEGPLDLLLFLIKKDEIDIYDIPIAQITAEYLKYIKILKDLDLDVAGEFLVMAATLVHIKSKLLLPADPVEVDQVEEDPRAELVQRLLEYKKFKEAAGDLFDMENKRKAVHPRKMKPDLDQVMKEDYSFDDGEEASIFELITAFVKVVKNFSREDVHQVSEEQYTVTEKMHDLYHLLVSKPVIHFIEIFGQAKSKGEAITIFLAVLELIRLNEIKITQTENFGEIEIKRNPNAAPREFDEDESIHNYSKHNMDLGEIKKEEEDTQVKEIVTDSLEEDSLKEQEQLSTDIKEDINE